MPQAKGDSSSLSAEHLATDIKRFLEQDVVSYMGCTVWVHSPERGRGDSCGHCDVQHRIALDGINEWKFTAEISDEEKPYDFLDGTIITVNSVLIFFPRSSRAPSVRKATGSTACLYQSVTECKADISRVLQPPSYCQVEFVLASFLTGSKKQLGPHVLREFWC